MRGDSDRQPAAASGSDPPFPVSPSGGKPGREGSPHAGARCAPAKTAGTHHAPAPPTRGAAATLCIPRSGASAYRAWARGREDRFKTSTKGTTGAVYTKYLTLPEVTVENDRLVRENKPIVGSRNKREFITVIAEVEFSSELACDFGAKIQAGVSSTLRSGERHL